MIRLRFVRTGFCCLVLGVMACGCRGYQYGHLLKPQQEDMVGSHTAGSEVYKPLVDEAVARLLATCEPLPSSPNEYDELPGTCKICFVGIENKSAEELGDFKDQLYEMIDTQINRSGQFDAVSRRMVDAALIETRMRPDSLLVPGNMQLFTSVLQRNGQPVDYLMFATLTSGTTQRNSSTQRDYLLTLEVVDTRTGAYRKEQAEIRKGYHTSPMGKLANYSLWPKAGR
ncbi:MAG: penicillin-binding protein activator LpoB [Planctomycetaceae bacterium]|nr:penicillin-binding protein activator LpoB [Planctomycetaceae bacterium]